ncbi:hypothetical protein BCR39DRAFT_5828 [Naematelia encephala]|uniref:Uncharacterized protein n=1 Tax=Naematelia encephala TaxID=71784 RepID=A0A1Y2BKV9_9TREE|nr:hypothetical protein BCR39DRAFT_5828 [Naematelia encephala]
MPATSPSSTSAPPSSIIGTSSAMDTPAPIARTSTETITTAPPTTATVPQAADTSSRSIYTLTPFIRPPSKLPTGEILLDWVVRVTINDGSGTGSDVRRDHPVCEWVNSQFLECKGPFYIRAEEAWKTSGISFSKTGERLTRVESKTGERLTWDQANSEWLTLDTETRRVLKKQKEEKGERLEGVNRDASYIESLKAQLQSYDGQEEEFTDDSSGTVRTYRIKWGSTIAPVTDRDKISVTTRRSTASRRSSLRSLSQKLSSMTLLSSSRPKSATGSNDREAPPEPNGDTATDGASELQDGASTWESAQCWGGMVVW